MASIHKELTVAASAEKAWATLRQVSEVHKLFAPVLTDAHMAGAVRTVQFANGLVVEERIVDIDDQKRRIAYSAVKGTPMTHHNASMQIVDAGPGQCRFVWISDFLPDEAAKDVAPLVEQGAAALKRNLEA